MLDILEEINEKGYHDMTKDELVFNFNNEQPKLNTNYKEDETFKNVQVMLMCVNNSAFKLNSKTYNLSLLGKTMKDWVLNSVKDFSVREIECNFNDDFLPLVKQNINVEKKYTLVLFSDTPLIKNSTIKEIIEYFTIKDLSVLKFTRGFMFKTEYLITIDKLYNPQMHYFDEEDFITCFNLKQYSLVMDILKARIIAFHQNNGVVIEDATSTIIDADVSIDSGVIVKASSKILGKSLVESGAVISYNSLIDSSVIMANSLIENSIIKNSIVGKNSVVKNYSIVENNAFIGENCTLSGFNSIKSKSLIDGITLKEFEKRE